MAIFVANSPWCTLPSLKFLSLCDDDYHQQNPPLDYAWEEGIEWNEKNISRIFFPPFCFGSFNGRNVSFASLSGRE